MCYWSDCAHLRRHDIALAAEALLLGEVSDTTLADDPGRKRLLYARAGVANYWVADVDTVQLRVFAEPRDGDDRRVDVMRSGDSAPLDRVRYAYSARGRGGTW